MFIVQYHGIEYPEVFNNAKFDSREKAQWYLDEFKSAQWKQLKIVATFTVKLKDKK